MTPGLTSAELSAALAELDAAQAPAGVAPADFAQLKAALRAQLIARAAAKAASTPPSGSLNTIDDIAFNDAGGGDWTVTWSYKNRGDYDLNGEVNLSDLTPIGQHYHATAASGDWAVASHADGDGNGEVNLGDITPIGQSYLAQVAGYNIYGSASQSGPWTYVGTTDFSAANQNVYPPTFSYHLGTRSYAHYLLGPRDFAGIDNISHFASAPSSPYLPGTLGVTYTYHIVKLLAPFDWGKQDDSIYKSVANPLGPGVWYQLQNGGGKSETGPVFDGVQFIGMEADYGMKLTNQGGAGAAILPSALTPGAQWAGDLYLGNPGDPYLQINTGSTYAGLEDVTIGSTTYTDCVKVTVQGAVQSPYPGDLSPLEGTYWLAKDVGLVRFSVTYVGIETARVDLVSRTGP